MFNILPVIQEKLWLQAEPILCEAAEDSESLLTRSSLFNSEQVVWIFNVL